MKHYMFNDKNEAKLIEVGGKAKSLMTLTAGGFLVPPGAVLTVDFFGEWIKALVEEEEFNGMWYDPSKFKELGIKLKEKAAKFIYSEKQKSIIMAIQTELKNTRLFAVRSSSPEEDLAGASFAGGYETILGVTKSTMEYAIKEAFISCMDERVFFYKHQNGFDTAVLRIAVVIQEQIASEVSGVGFSLNPLNNCFDEAVINANTGLGESVVSGMVTPDEIVVDKNTGQILSKVIGSKEQIIVLKEGGGTKVLNQSDSKQKLEALDSNQISALTKLIVDIEKFYGFPVDIEWAFADGHLYLLQSRPITTYVPLAEEMQTKPGEQRVLYLDGSLVKQGITVPLTVMGCDCLTVTQEVMFEDLMGKDVTADVLTGLATTRGGRMYINVSSTAKFQGLKRMANSWEMVDVTSAHMMRELNLDLYMPKKTPEILKGAMWGAIKNNIGAIGLTRKATKDPDAYKRWYQPFEDEYDVYLKNIHTTDLSIEEAPKAIFKKYIELLGKMVPMTYAAELARKSISKQLEKDFEDGYERMQYLERSLPDNVTIDMGLAMYELSQMTEFKNTDPAMILENIEAGKVSDGFINGWGKYLERFGCRTATELDVGVARSSDNLEELVAQIRGMSHVDEAFSPLTIYKASKELREKTYKELVGLISGNRLKKIEKNYKTLVTLGGKREALKYWFIRALTAIRELILVEADKLVEAGRLNHRDEVFWLHLDELVAGLKAESSHSRAYDLKGMIAHNQEFYKQLGQVKAFPKFIDSRGKILTLPPVEAKEGEVGGQPISPGVVTGRVKVLHTPDEKPLLQGEIMVTRATDPGWTPLFINAAAIVLEVGGLLQHGALVAREYGKPCIAGVEDAMNVLHDGQLVSVDATRGIITFLEEEENETQK